jgi:hypothetical protein
MTHTEAATEPTYAIMGSEYYLDWLKNYGEGALGSLTATLVGWNKGRSAAQDWVAEGSNIEDLQDSTKILLTNFMVGMEKFVEGDWAKLSSELFDEILEVAGVVNCHHRAIPRCGQKSHSLVKYPTLSTLSTNLSNRSRILRPPWICLLSSKDWKTSKTRYCQRNYR